MKLIKVLRLSLAGLLLTVTAYASDNVVVVQIANPEATIYATSYKMTWNEESKPISGYFDQRNRDMLKRMVSVTFGRVVKYDSTFHVFKSLYNAIKGSEYNEYDLTFVMLKDSELLEIACHAEAHRDSLTLQNCATSDGRKVEFGGAVGDRIGSRFTSGGNLDVLSFDVSLLRLLKQSQ